MNVEYVDHMGTDLSVVNAARVSFDNKSDWENVEKRFQHIDPDTGAITSYVAFAKELKQKDKNLIEYLARGLPSKEWRNKISEILGHAIFQTDYSVGQVERIVDELANMATHWVPFTHTAITLRMSAPYPIRTQCFKHKIGFTESEESRRYIKSTPELYLPDFRLAALNVKQGSGDIHPDNTKLQDAYELHCRHGIKLYEDMLHAGVAPETARFILPLGCEVKWIWTGNLASYARYYNQRNDSHAQLESQNLANDVAKVIEPLFPVSWKALTRT